MSKTPHFDKAIAAILDNLEPHQRTCRNARYKYPWCFGDFPIEAEDIEFYKSFQVPPQTLCPQCRAQRKMAMRMPYVPVFHKKKCAAPGHDEKVITFYSEQNDVKIYDDHYYASDDWDGLEFGRDVNPDVSFFDQFIALAKDVPHQSLQRDLTSVNCDYTTSGKTSKNCYYVSVPYETEDVQYSMLPVRSKNSIELYETDESEKCYASINIKRCFNCQYSIDLQDCLDSYFLYDCRNSSNCFMSSNLRNKQYVFENEQLTKEAYKDRIAKINFSSRQTITQLKEQFKDVLQNAMHKHVQMVKVENSRGDNIDNCKDCYYAFRGFKGPNENLRYVLSFTQAKDAMDVFGFGESQRIYESTACVNASDMKFNIFARGGMDNEYCIETKDCEHCFGCFGLKKKKYCIFNKQYTEDKYWQKVDQIKTAMLSRGEYGEFYPHAMSPHPYNESHAGLEYPLTKEQILQRNWYYEEPQPSDVDVSQFDVLEPIDVPDDIKDVSDDVLKKVLICDRTAKPYRLTSFELSFYRANNIPLPIIHPHERLLDLFVHRRPYMLYDDICKQCGTQIDTIYNPKRNLKVLCESCYLKEVA